MTTNELFDAVTGAVLITSAQNEFNDDLYATSIPAYWANKEMGGAYKNIKYEFESTFKEGVSKTFEDNEIAMFTEGDVIAGEGVIGWVNKVDASAKTITVINKNGDGFDMDELGDFFILHSGYKNLLEEEIAQVISKKNPYKLASGSLRTNLAFSNVLVASASEFKGDWNMSCDCGFSNESTLQNHFVFGAKNNWNEVNSFTYLDKRTQTLTGANNNTNIKNDGTYSSFVFPYNISTWTLKSKSKLKSKGWIVSKETTKKNRHGYSVESRNSLGVYSSAVLGFGSKIPISIGVNAKQSDIGFESFEDHSFEDCSYNGGHFSFKDPLIGARTYTPQLDVSRSHTGRTSLRIPPSQSVKLNKRLTQESNTAEQ